MQIEDSYFSKSLVLFYINSKLLFTSNSYKNEKNKN